MNIFRFFQALLVFVGLGFPAQAEDIRSVLSRQGSWTVTINSVDGLQFCDAHSYQGMYRMSLGVVRDGYPYLQIRVENYVSPVERDNLAIQVDNNTPWLFKDVATTGPTATILLPANSQVNRAFMQEYLHGNQLWLLDSYERRVFSLSLQGSYKAFLALVECEQLLEPQL